MTGFRSYAAAAALSAALAAACAGSPHRPAADRRATAETCALYANLFSEAGRGTMFGHQDDALYGHGWAFEAGRSDVLECCGDFPAVFGWEIGGLETDSERSLDDVPFAAISGGICAARDRGAVNTVSWHPRNPESGGSAWDCRTTTAVRSILPGGERHAEYLTWLDRLAAFFSGLRAADGSPAPVLFRPFHENTSTGFWWGEAQCTPDEYRALWRMTVSYLRDTKGVHNLLYVYSPDLFRDAGHYLERYPGDEWVDVLGLDAYHRPGEWDFSEGCRRMLSCLQRLGRERHKPTAFTETGLEGIPDTHWWTHTLLPAISGRGLSWVLVWRNAHDRPEHFFAPWHGHASESDFRDFAANDGHRIIFLSDLRDMYSL